MFWTIMKDCVQWNSVYGWEDFTSREDRTRFARSGGQRLTHYWFRSDVSGLSFWQSTKHNSCLLPYKFYVLGQVGLSKQCRPRSDCFWRSSLIRVYAVCHSISIFWMHSCKVSSNFSIFTTIMAIVWGVPNFRIFTVPSCYGSISMSSSFLWFEWNILCMPSSSRIISGMLPEKHTMEECDFLKPIIHNLFL